MNPLLSMISIQQGPVLPQSAMLAAAPAIDFDVQLTAALAVSDKVTGQQQPQIAEVIAEENPIDSSISVAVDVRHALPFESSITPAVFSDGPAPLLELPEPVQSAVNQTAEPVAGLTISVALPPIPVSPPQQTPSLPIPTPTTRANPIAFTPIKTARPIETKIAPTPRTVETVSGFVRFEELFASVVSVNPSAAKLESSKPTLDMHASDWAARLSQEILYAHEGPTPDISFRLTPKHLGTLDVGLTETPHGLIVELRPSSEEAKAMLMREEPRLIDELRQRGVPVADPALQSGANDDGRHNRNGAIPRPFLPFRDLDQKTVQDQDQHSSPQQGRFA